MYLTQSGASPLIIKWMNWMDVSVKEVFWEEMTETLWPLYAIGVWSEVKATQSCAILCRSMDYTVRGILQGRILEWVACSLLQGIFPTQGSNTGFPHCKRIFLPADSLAATRETIDVYPAEKFVEETELSPGCVMIFPEDWGHSCTSGDNFQH